MCDEPFGEASRGFVGSRTRELCESAVRCECGDSGRVGDVAFYQGDSAKDEVLVRLRVPFGGDYETRVRHAPAPDPRGCVICKNGSGGGGCLGSAFEGNSDGCSPFADPHVVSEGNGISRADWSKRHVTCVKGERSTESNEDLVPGFIGKW
mgnify:CR=1 FL=1